MPLRISILYPVSCIKKFSKKYTKYIILNTKYRKSKGFTLIELLVAITIIGILASIVLFSFDKAREKARDSRRKNDLAAIKAATVLYYQDLGYFPPNPVTYPSIVYTSDTGKNWLPEMEEYIKDLPQDPKQAGINLNKFLANILTISPRPVYGATADIWVSNDGNSWTSRAFGYPGTSPIAYDISSYSPNYDYVLDSNKNIYQYYPSSSSWSILTTCTPCTNPVDFTVVSDLGDEYYDVLDASGNIYRWVPRSHGRSAWETLTSGFPGGTAKAFYSRSTGAVVLAQNGSIYYSSGPGSWSTLATGYPGTNPIDIKAQSGNNLNFVLDASGNIYYTGISGWQTYASGYPGTVAKDLGYFNKVLDTNGNIYSANGGTSWTTDATNFPGGEVVELEDHFRTRVFAKPGVQPQPSDQPVPSSGPTQPPQPGPSGDCSIKKDIYCYIVSEDRQEFILWAQLENKNDPEAAGKDSAICNENPPSVNFNYCLISPR